VGHGRSLGDTVRGDRKLMAWRWQLHRLGAYHCTSDGWKDFIDTDRRVEREREYNEEGKPLVWWHEVVSFLPSTGVWGGNKDLAHAEERGEFCGG